MTHSLERTVQHGDTINYVTRSGLMSRPPDQETVVESVSHPVSQKIGCGLRAITRTVLRTLRQLRKRSNLTTDDFLKLGGVGRGRLKLDRSGYDELLFGS